MKKLPKVVWLVVPASLDLEYTAWTGCNIYPTRAWARSDAETFRQGNGRKYRVVRARIDPTKPAAGRGRK